MTLLNTPMPADKVIGTMLSMYASNMMIRIDFKAYSGIWKTYEDVGPNERLKYIRDIDMGEPITILKVNLKVPTYEIGQKVLILSTGKIGTLDNMFYKQETGEIIHTGRYMVALPNGKEIPNVHWSEICKLPNDL